MAEDPYPGPVGRVRYKSSDNRKNVAQEGSLESNREELQERRGDLAVREQRLRDGVAEKELLVGVVLSRTLGRTLDCGLVGAVREAT